MPGRRASPPPLTLGAPWVANPDPDELVAVLAELHGLATVRDDPDGDEERDFDQADAVCSVGPLVETLLDEPPTPALTALLLLVCRHPVTAELIALQCAFGRQAAERDIADLIRVSDRARRRGLTTAEYVEQLQRDGWEPDTPSARMLAGETARRPDEGRMHQGIRVLRHAVAYADDEQRANIFCAVGWLHWARGQRANAQAYLTDALVSDPGHPTALYLSTMVGAMLPRWIMRPVTAQASPITMEA